MAETGWSLKFARDVPCKMERICDSTTSCKNTLG